MDEDVTGISTSLDLGCGKASLDTVYLDGVVSQFSVQVDHRHL